MKKIFVVMILLVVFLLSIFQVMAFQMDTTMKSTLGPRDFTHTVFAEFATETTCYYCHFARGALDAIYASHDTPFFYVSLVKDKNTHAEVRNTEYNCGAFPTVFFDGGYNVFVGGFGYQENENRYRQAIANCSNRSVADIQTNLNVVWLDNATINIEVSLHNNETSSYLGRLRIYVCEVESSMGWNDTIGHPYTFPFLDYAFNQNIVISAEGTWGEEITWDGHDHDDGYDHTFGSIQNGNIAVIAAVFNATWHQGYSWPPNAGPFDMYWPDDCVGTIVGVGPFIPGDPNPVNGAEDVPINQVLSWTGGGTPGITFSYDICFGTVNPPPRVMSNLTTTSYNPGILDYTTQYYWKIVSWDPFGHSVSGPIWSFTTGILSNVVPDPPTITGPGEGTPGNTYKFTITGTDPDADDMVSAYVQWGDETVTNWTAFHTSGEPFSVTHSWMKKGDYTVKVKLKDTHGAESGWTTLSVTMPKSFDLTNPFLHWLLERFPHAFPLLRHLMGY